MSIVKITIIKLIEKKQMTEETGKIVMALLEHKALNTYEIQQKTGLDYDTLIENIVWLMTNGIIEKRNEKIKINEPFEALNILMDLTNINYIVSTN